MTEKSLHDLAKCYEVALSTLDRINKSIDEAWDNGDKRQAKNLECGSDEYIDTLFEVEEEIENYFKEESK